MPAYLMTVIFCVVVERTAGFCVTVVPCFLHMLKILEFVMICWELHHHSIFYLLCCKQCKGCLALLCCLPRVLKSRCAWLYNRGGDVALTET